MLTRSGCSRLGRRRLRPAPCPPLPTWPARARRPSRPGAGTALSPGTERRLGSSISAVKDRGRGVCVAWIDPYKRRGRKEGGGENETQRGGGGTWREYNRGIGIGIGAWKQEADRGGEKTRAEGGGWPAYVVRAEQLLRDSNFARHPSECFVVGDFALLGYGMRADASPNIYRSLVYLIITPPSARGISTRNPRRTKLQQLQIVGGASIVRGRTQRPPFNTIFEQQQMKWRRSNQVSARPSP